MPLYEKHRPTRLQAVVGQSATVSALQGMIERGLDRGAFFFMAPPGQGKTSLGRALARELGVSDMCMTQIVGAQCDAEFVRRLMVDITESSLFDEGTGWKAWQIDEAHKITSQGIQLFLGLLENMPAKRLIIFTSNSSLECYGEFKGAFMSRCHVFHLELDLEAAAQHVAKIASDEGLNGQPLSAYRALLARCEGNIRAALQRVEQGEMLRCETTLSPAQTEQPAPSSSRLSTSSKAGSSLQTSATIPARAPSVIRSIESAIAAEVERGKKFCVGSVKWGLHKDRLAELEAQR